MSGFPNVNPNNLIAILGASHSIKME